MRGAILYAPGDVGLRSPPQFSPALGEDARTREREDLA
jgi:hypothetical protein